MNIHVSALALLMFLTAITGAEAEYAMDPPDTPLNSSFENTPQGIGIKLALKTRSENAKITHLIRLYLKNNLNLDAYYSRHPDANHLEIKYISNKNILVPLRPYHYGGVINSNSSPIVIKPGHVLSIDISLSEDEWKLVQGQSIVCSCNIFAGNSGLHLLSIASSPKSLE